MAMSIQEHIDKGIPLPDLQPTIGGLLDFCKLQDCTGVVREGVCVKCGFPAVPKMR